jgi:hypothetical protein
MGKGYTVESPKIIYSLISKEMSSLYFGLGKFCLFEARALQIGDVSSPSEILG